MATKRKDALLAEHARRQYRNIPASPSGANWSDVPDAVILDLIRSYTAGGDAILFGTSADQSVLALRVYRQGQGYSVYARGLDHVGEAVERLHKYRPPRSQRAPIGAVSPPAVQGYSNLDLPFHPSFSPDQLNKQRLEAVNRAIRWNALVDSLSIKINEVASG